MGLFESFKPSEADIITNKKTGVVYVADFPQGSGKYISVVEDSEGEIPDLDIKISSRIQLRITYLTNNEKISGVEISKVTGDKVEKINFSTLDFERILQLLNLFSELDLKAITNKTLVLNESIIGNPYEMNRFLQLVASDPEGKQKMSEVAKNYGLIKIGDIDDIVQKKEAVNLFSRILNDENEFKAYKYEIKVGKDEEVWQKFFSNNSWILGSDFVEILDERRLDVDDITDYLLKSFDGFVDIVELKLPSASFWTTEIIPKCELTKATMQCNRYILQTERRINDLEFSKKVKNTPIVKPRITLIYGRSNNWIDVHREAYRVLNSSYSNLNIITYDHLLERAKRLTGPSCIKETVADTGDNFIDAENLPF
ncbi:MAG: DUF4263 domain-containing protein [bacterium]|nr:DUF4263 domain-containing protein [bacterium]